MALAVLADDRFGFSVGQVPNSYREIGLAWRKSTTRSAEFHALGELIKTVWQGRMVNRSTA